MNSVGGKGATLSGLGCPKSSGAARQEFDSALAELVRVGKAVRIEKSGKLKFYARGSEPPSPEEMFRRTVLEKVAGRGAWLEDVLTGKGEKAVEKRRLLDELVRAGRLARIEVVTSSKARKSAYLAPGVLPASSIPALPEWPEIEAAAHEIAATRFDHTVSFEALAERLGVTTLVVKTAVDDRMRRRGGLQLIRGEPREVRDPDSAGFHSGGDVYFRFRFLDAMP